MKYHLVHITYDYLSFYQDVLVREDPKLPDMMETKAGSTRGKWCLESKWRPIHQSVWDSIKLSIKNGVCKRELVRYEARELTDGEAAMILFCKEGGQLE